MPQTFQVLRCYKCAVFQVHPTKKCNKWKCKMCGEKQSMKRFYGPGTGQECRLHVQKFNAIRGDIENTNCESKDAEQSNESDNSERSNEKEPVHYALPKNSKWQDYVDKEYEVNELQDPSPDETEIILEPPKKRHRKIINEANETGLLPEKVICSINNSTNVCVMKSIDTNRPVVSRYNNVFMKDDPNECCTNQRAQNSKCSQFIEDTQSASDDSATSKCNNSQDESRIMFSFVDDDDDLDALLEF